jgi:phosphatidylserine/phosphatidylglycerophosphate/cardiolipin synthase-like enzyme
LHVYCPRTRKGRIIIVHAKLTIIDDRLLRIGSANLNNRSMGFDTECDLVVEGQEGGDGDGLAAAIAAFRTALVAHWLELPPKVLADEAARLGGLAAAIEALDGGDSRRLRPLEPKPLGPLSDLIARYHLGDPISTADAWRPWDRKRAMERILGEARLKAARLKPAES